MAITVVRERRSHRYRFGYEDNQPLPTQELTRTFWVYSDVDDEDPTVVLAASGLPQYGDAHPDVPAALAQEFRIERDEEYLKRWLVEVEYMSRRIRGSDGNGDPNQDPTLVTQIEVSTVQGTRVLTRDRDGGLIVLPSGERFVYECAWNELQLDFTQYRSVLDAEAYVQLATYRNAINSDTWRGFAPKTARVVAIAGRDVDINGTRYLERRISIQLRGGDPIQPDWDERVANQGFYYKQLNIGIPGGDPAGLWSALLPILDPETGVHTTKPYPMTEDGTAVLPAGATPNFITVKAYPMLPFSALNI